MAQQRPLGYATTMLASAVLQGFAWLGRHGTQGFALSLVLGLALPQFAAAARPLLAVSIFIFVMLTFARADLGAVWALLKRPGRLLLACAWLIAAPLALVGGLLALVGRDALDPGLTLGLAVMAAAPPIMSSPAVAMMLGLNPTLLLSAVMATTLAAPLLAPLLVDVVAGAAVPLDATVLIQRLAILVGGALAAALLLRRLLGPERLATHARSLDGVGVLMYFIFAIAAMDGVLVAILERPGLVALFMAIAFAVAGAGFAASWLALRHLPASERFVLGYATGQRNMGLLIAALGSAAPTTTFLFFAIAQFPIYLMPQIVKPAAERLRRAAERGTP